MAKRLKHKFYPFYPLLVWLTTCLIATPLSLIIVKGHTDNFLESLLLYDVTFLLMIFFIVNLTYLVIVALSLSEFVAKIMLAALAISGILITDFVLYEGQKTGMVYSVSVVISSVIYRVYHRSKKDSN